MVGEGRLGMVGEGSLGMRLREEWASAQQIGLTGQLLD